MNCEVLQSTSCFGTSMTAYGFCIMFGQHSYACVRVVFFHWYNFYSDRILFFFIVRMLSLYLLLYRYCFLPCWSRTKIDACMHSDMRPISMNWKYRRKPAFMCVRMRKKNYTSLSQKWVCWVDEKKKRSGDYSSWYACLERNSVIDMENHHIWL